MTIVNSGLKGLTLYIIHCNYKLHRSILILWFREEICCGLCVFNPNKIAFKNIRVHVKLFVSIECKTHPRDDVPERDRQRDLFQNFYIFVAPRVACLVGRRVGVWTVTRFVASHVVCPIALSLGVFCALYFNCSRHTHYLWSVKGCRYDTSSPSISSAHAPLHAFLSITNKKCSVTFVFKAITG